MNGVTYAGTLYSGAPLTTANSFSMIGYVGTPPLPTVAVAHSPGVPVPNTPYNFLSQSVGAGYAASAFNNDPKCFFVGDTLTNYQLPGTGGLWFMCNNPANLINGTGVQLVRVIVTK